MECKSNVIVDFHPPRGAICSRWQARFQQPRRGEQEAERHTKKEVGVPYMAYKIRKVKGKKSDQSSIIPGTNKYKQYFAQAHYFGCHIWRHTCVSKASFKISFFSRTELKVDANGCHGLREEEEAKCAVP